MGLMLNRPPHEHLIAHDETKVRLPCGLLDMLTGWISK